MFLRLISLLTLLALCLASCSKHSKDGFSSRENLEASLDSIFRPIFPEDGPGAAVVVMEGDSMIYGKGFGLARLDSLSKVDLNTMFNICSVSKQFSAVALLKLAEEGKLSLDDSVMKFFPNLPQKVFAGITLRHLLSHTSGIPDSRPRNPEQWAEYLKHHKSQFNNVRDFVLFCEEDESLGYLESLDSLSFTPGSQYEYMNPTFQMMLSIVEQASGENFDDWMQRNIFQPAGMTETLYFEPNKYISRMAHGYERDSIGQWHESDYGEATFFGTKADGGIYTSPMQFVQWDRAIFNDKVISAESRREAHTGYIDTDIPYTRYGYGWFVENKPGRPQKIYHTGDNGGFYIFEGRFPERELFYLIFATHPHWDRDAVAESVDSVLL